MSTAQQQQHRPGRSGNDPGIPINADTLWTFRRVRGFSRREVAEHLTENGWPCTEAAVQKWEKGKSRPTREAVRLLASFYGCTQRALGKRWAA